MNKNNKIIDIKTLFTEFFGSFIIIYLTASIIIYNKEDNNSNSAINTSLAEGVIISMICLLGHDISGGMYNPAITIGYAFINKLELNIAFFYILSQFFGSLMGAAFVFIQMSDDKLANINIMDNIGYHKPYNNLEIQLESVISELIGAFFLSYAYNSLKIKELRKNKFLNVILIGMVTSIVLLTIKFVSGGNLNPFKIIAPCIIFGKLNNINFLFIIAQIIGSIIASVIYKSIYYDPFSYEVIENIDKKENNTSDLKKNLIQNEDSINNE